MVLINKFISILSVIVTFILFELILFFPQLFLLNAVLILLVIVLTVLKLNKWKISRESIIFIIIPLLFLGGGLLFLLFLEKSILRHVIIIILNFLYGIYLDNLFIYLYKTDKYQPYALENISSYISIISAFLIYAAFFGFIIFFKAPVWLLGITTFVTTVVLGYQVVCLNKIELNRSWLFILIYGLLIAELFGVVYFLPVSFYVAGVTLTAMFYLMTNLGRYHLLANLNSQVVRRHLIVGSLVLIIVLITARWT